MRLVCAVTVLVSVGLMSQGTAEAASGPRVATPVITSAPPTYTASTSATLVFTDSTKGATFQCSRDYATYTTCKSPVTYTALKTGSHRFAVRASATGLRTSRTTSKTWTIDTTAPTAPTLSQPATPNTLSSVPFTFSSTSIDLASYQCSIDAAAFATCTSPKSVVVATDGAHTLAVKAVDRAGNVSPTASAAWYRDTVTPVPVVSSGPPSSTSSVSATFVYGSSESGVSFSCSLDGGAFSACSGGKVYSALSLATHTFRVKATDALGNTATSATYTWKVAAVVPVSLSWTTPASLPAPVTKATTGSFDFTMTGETTKECRLDGALLASCTTPLSVSGLGEGSHIVTITGDPTQPTQVSLSYSWTIDKTPPAAPSVSGPTGPVATSSAVVTVTASDPSDPLTCSFDSVPVSCASLATLSSLADGSHTASAVESDAAGNTANASRTWTVDTVAPTSATAAPTTILTGGGVSFNEPVKGVTAVTVVLELSTGTAVAHAVGCRNASNVTVSCAGSAVRRAFVVPTSPLIPGENYRLRVIGGAAGVRDLAGNPTAPTTKNFRAAVLQESTSPAIIQTWHTVKSSSAKGGSYVAERRAGASAAWKSSGTSITWYTVTGPTFGIATVYVDGLKRSVVNNYATKPRFGVARTVVRLASKVHTVRVVVNGVKGSTKAKGFDVAVDAVKLGSVISSTPVLATAWASTNAKPATSGSYRSADLAGQVAQMTFRGTAVTWVTATGKGSGIAAVYIDGKLKATVDTYSSVAKFKVARTFVGLTNARHTIRVIVLGKHRKGGTGTRVVVDAFKVV